MRRLLSAFQLFSLSAFVALAGHAQPAPAAWALHLSHRDGANAGNVGIDIVPSSAGLVGFPTTNTTASLITLDAASMSLSSAGVLYSLGGTATGAMTLAGPNASTGTNSFAGLNTFSATLSATGTQSLSGSTYLNGITSVANWGNYIFVNQGAGNDSTATVGQPLRQYQTLAAAMAVATTNSTIILEGSFTYTQAATISLSAGQTLRGEGQFNQATIVAGTNLNAYLLTNVNNGPTTTSDSNITIAYLHFNGNASNQSGTWGGINQMILLQGTPYLRLLHDTFENPKGFSVNITHFSNVLADDIAFFQPAINQPHRDGLHYNGGDGAIVTHVFGLTHDDMIAFCSGTEGLGGTPTLYSGTISDVMVKGEIGASTDSFSIGSGVRLDGNSEGMSRVSISDVTGHFGRDGVTIDSTDTTSAVEGVTITNVNIDSQGLYFGDVDVDAPVKDLTIVSGDDSDRPGNSGAKFRVLVQPSTFTGNFGAVEDLTIIGGHTQVDTSGQTAVDLYLRAGSHVTRGRMIGVSHTALTNGNTPGSLLYVEGTATFGSMTLQNCSIANENQMVFFSSSPGVGAVLNITGSSQTGSGGAGKYLVNIGTGLYGGTINMTGDTTDGAALIGGGSGATWSSTFGLSTGNTSGGGGVTVSAVSNSGAITISSSNGAGTALTGTTLNGLTLSGSGGMNLGTGTLSLASGTATLIAGTEFTTAGGTITGATTIQNALTVTGAFTDTLSPISVSSGGTGTGTYAVNAPLLGNGTSGFLSVALPVTSSYVLTTNTGSAPTFQPASGGGGSTTVTNSDGTITVGNSGSSPTTVSVALGHANTWTGAQTVSISGAGPALTLSSSGTALTISGGEILTGALSGASSLSTSGAITGNVITANGGTSTFNNGVTFNLASGSAIQIAATATNNSNFGPEITAYRGLLALWNGITPAVGGGINLGAYPGPQTSGSASLAMIWSPVDSLEIDGGGSSFTASPNIAAAFADLYTATASGNTNRYIFGVTVTTTPSMVSVNTTTATNAYGTLFGQAPLNGSGFTATNRFSAGALGLVNWSGGAQTPTESAGVLTVTGAGTISGSFTGSSSVLFPGLSQTGAVEFVGESSTTSGNIVGLTTAAAATLLGISSRTVKHDITDFAGALEIVDRIDVRRFHYNADSGLGYDPSRWYYGPIAEELATIFPDAVDQTPGHPPSVNDRIVLGIDTNAIKELHTYTNRLVAAAFATLAVLMLLTGHNWHLHRKLNRINQTQ